MGREVCAGRREASTWQGQCAEARETGKGLHFAGWGARLACAQGVEGHMRHGLVGLAWLNRSRNENFRSALYIYYFVSHVKRKASRTAFDSARARPHVEGTSPYAAARLT